MQARCHLALYNMLWYDEPGTTTHCGFRVSFVLRGCYTCRLESLRLARPYEALCKSM